MPRGKNCRETIFAAQKLPCNYPHHGGSFERGRNVLSSVGERQFGRHLKKTIWARVIESQKLPRDSGESIFAARHQDVSQGPLGTKKMSRLVTKTKLKNAKISIFCRLQGKETHPQSSPTQSKNRERGKRAVVIVL